MISFGLTVEARKRLTIGVELAAKPELLLFLDVREAIGGR
jgi:ATP-binding cassette subfamily G (WHITE) protein 2 (SNQ2)